MTRRLIIDCQILQTAAFDRGMGKYTLSLLQSFIAQNDQIPTYLEVILLFSKNLNDNPERLSTIQRILKGTSITLLNIPTNIAENLHGKYEDAEKKVTDYVLSLAKMDTDFLITSPFFVDFPAVFPNLTTVGKYSLVYDLIPYKIWHLQRIFGDDIYARHFELFIQADGLFTISHAVKADLVNLLGISPNKITSIDGGPFMQAKPAALKLKKPYVLFPSAPIVHKNNKRAVESFKLFNEKNDNAYTLYITSTFDDATQRELCAITDRLVFTGNISDGELAFAYQHASAVFFPSLAEGLGMPVLEGVMHGVPVACSDIPVLSELSNIAFYNFDPNNVTEMAQALDNAVSKKEWKVRKDAYKKIQDTYTWERSAALMIEVLAKTPVQRTKPKKTIMYQLPQPNRNTAGGRLGEYLFASLAEQTNLVVQCMGSKPADVPSYLAYLPTQMQLTNSSIRIKQSRLHLKKQAGRLLKVDYTLNPESGIPKHGSLKIYAQPILVDEALHMPGWRFRNEVGKALEPETILASIFKGEKL